MKNSVNIIQNYLSRSKRNLKISLNNLTVKYNSLIIQRHRKYHNWRKFRKLRVKGSKNAKIWNDNAKNSDSSYSNWSKAQNYHVNCSYRIPTCWLIKRKNNYTVFNRKLMMCWISYYHDFWYFYYYLTINAIYSP